MILYGIVLRCIVLYRIVLYCLACIVLCCIYCVGLYCVVLYCTIYLQEWTPSTLFENTVFGLDVKTKSAFHRQIPYEYTNPVESAASMAGTVYLIDNWLYSLWLLYSEYSTESIWRN